MFTVISAMDLHRQAGDLLARIRYRGERFIIKRRGQAVAVLLDIAEYQQLEALAAKQRATERDRHFADFESALETAPPPEADSTELGDDVIQAEVHAVREARYAPSPH
ncbi:MAG: type II toxin-antitoxin system Phd/YefM family antitoxin [Anaerolineae bacterium]